GAPSVLGNLSPGAVNHCHSGLVLPANENTNTLSTPVSTPSDTTLGHTSTTKAWSVDLAHGALMPVQSDSSVSSADHGMLHLGARKLSGGQLVTKDQATIIIVLLAGIFGVLLAGSQGAHNLLENLGVFLLVALVVYVGWAIVRGVAKGIAQLSREIPYEIRRMRKDREPWIANTVIIILAFTGAFVLFGYGIGYWMGDKEIRSLAATSLMVLGAIMMPF